MNDKTKENMDILEDLMRHSILEMPFNDMEDRVMHKIANQKPVVKPVTSELRFSWVFFLLGTFAGIALSLLIPQLKEPLFGVPPQKLALIFQFSFIVLFFMQIETLSEIVKRVYCKQS